MGQTREGVDLDELTLQFDAFCNEQLPSNTTLWLRQCESKNQEFMESNYGRFCRQFEAGYDVLVSAIGYANSWADHTKWPRNRIVQHIMEAENIKPIYSAFDRLIKGYYVDCLVLARVAYEAFLRIIFVSLYPDDTYYSYARGKKVPRQFKLTNFIKEDLKLGWNEYEILSAMAHSYKFSVLKQIVEIGKNGQTEPLSLGFEQDELLIEICNNILDFLLLIYLEFTMAFLLVPLKECNVDYCQIDKINLYIMLKQKNFISHPNQYWQKVIGDLDYVFDLVRAAESGKDWKQVRESLKSR
ncbi:MAG: hypothetical protein ABFD64_10405 [Armatimonadota bacterium]